jgi:hypothetical protein
LFRIDAGAWGVLNIHERFILHNGKVAERLNGDFLHWSFVTVAEHVEKFNRYSEISAHEYHKAGKKSSFLSPFTHGFWIFFRKYILNAGFLDGKEGYIICSINGKSTYNKYKSLHILNKQKNAHE